MMGKVEKRNFRNHLLAAGGLTFMWIAGLLKYGVHHIAQYGTMIYPYDKMVLLVQGLLFIYAILLLGRNWKKKSLKNWLYTHPVIVLSYLMLLTSCVIYGRFLYGDYLYAFTDIGADTSEQYVPVIQMIVDKIVSHDFSMWEFNWGLGVDIANNQSLVFDPFNLPLYVLGSFVSRQAMLYALVLIQIVKCHLLGYFTYLFLKWFDLRPWSRVVAAYVCAFSGFMMLWGEHYFMASACVMLMLLFWLLEGCFHSEKYVIWMTLSVAITLSFSLYSSYMIALACFGYVVIKLAQCLTEANMRKCGTMILWLVGGVIIAALLSAVIALPVYYQLTQVTGRLATEQGIGGQLKEMLVTISPFHHQHSRFLRFFSNNLEGVGGNYRGAYNYFESEQIYFSVFFLPILGMFFSERVIRDRRKWIPILSAVLFVYAFVSPAIAYIFNRFTNSATRFSYIFIPLAAYAIAYVLSRWSSLHWQSAVIGVVGCLAGIAVMAVQCIQENDHVLIAHFVGMFLLLCGWVVILVNGTWGNSKDKNVRFFAYLICGTMIANVFCDGWITINYGRENWNRDAIVSQPASGIYTAQANAWIYETVGDEFVRTEKAYPEITAWNDALLQNYSGMSYYNTTYNKYVEKFWQECWPETLSNPTLGGSYVAFRQDANRAELAALLGIKYVLAAESSLSPAEYQVVYSINENYQVYENQEAASIGWLYGSSISESEFLQANFSTEEKRAILRQQVVLSDPEKRKDSSSAAHTERVAVHCERERSDGSFVVPVEASKTQLLFMAIPYDSGWHAWIDGVEVPVLRANLGFQAIEVTSGKHMVTWRYQSPYKKQGTILTIVGMVLLIFEILCIFRGLHKKHTDVNKM